MGKNTETVGKKVRVWNNVDRSRFEQDVVPLYEPAILKGIVSSWPAVKAGKVSDDSIRQYLTRMDTGAVGETYVGSHEMEGKYFYNSTMTGFNFDRIKEGLGKSLNRIFSTFENSNSKYIYTGSVSMGESMPEFLNRNPMPLINSVIKPRIWIGNKITVQAHFDQSDNIAAVVHGRRRFTLFPPSQISNMYVSPVEFTIAGPQISMVDVDNPDLEKHPQFSEALDAAMSAELGAGDALYIPSMWWHHVESLERFNILVNYWWSTQYGDDSPMATLLHGLLTMRNLSEGEKLAWKELFDHYVFHSKGDPVAHLDKQKRGVLGELNRESYKKIKSFLAQMLKSQFG